MTQEQDAANWQILQQYKQLRAERDQRETQARNWGFAMQSIGEVLVSGGVTANLDFSKLPEKAALLETRRELNLLHNQIASLRQVLQRAGMGDLL